MKHFLSYIFLALMLTFTACYKDKGNYDYTEVKKPIVTGIEDSTFSVYLLDTLRIKPTVEFPLGSLEDLSYEWKLNFPYTPWEALYEGPELNILYTHRPGNIGAMLTVTDRSNGMKYFYNFKISGITRFTAGTFVLTEEGGKAKLSFIQPDNTVFANVYEDLYNEPLPGKPLQLVALPQAYQPGTIGSYWVLCTEGNNPGVLLDANTLSLKKYLNENFFEAPSAIAIHSFQSSFSGVPIGVINGRFYRGENRTDPGSPYFGMFGADEAGKYELSPYIIEAFGQYYLGFDKIKRQFVMFKGDGRFIGTAYNAIPTGPGFDPKNVPLDIIYMKYLNNNTSFAYGKDATGKIYELKFSNAPEMFFHSYMREFKGASLVDENTKWDGTTQEVLYFTSKDKIYRYNHLNQEIKLLDADFGGRTVSMIKLATINKQDVLVAGTEGSLYYLDISTGKNGNIMNKVDGLPGKLVDAVVRL